MFSIFMKKECKYCGKKRRGTINYAGYDICSESCMLEFFKNTYNSGYTDGVSHVGIYIGDGKFIHNSSSKGKTVVSDLDNDYYKSHYLGAKHFDGAEQNTLPMDYAKNEVKNEDDLKWWGDLLVLILIVLLIALGVIFFMLAFGNDKISQSMKIIKAVS